MAEFSLTPRQKALIADWKKGRLRRINILDGSVRSGKTVASLILWALWLANRPKSGSYLMAGRSLNTLRRNCLEPMVKLFGADNVRFSEGARRAVIFGRRVDLEGAANALGEGRIRGMTLHGAYLDEITLLPRDFFVMLLSRLSAPGAMLLGTTNPDGPRHWLKTEFLDRPELDIYRARFLLEDNTALPPDYLRSLKKEYTGLFRRRYILGEWVAAEGAVYPMFEPERHVSPCPDELGYRRICVDYGHTNPTVFLCMAEDRDGCVWVTDEYYHASAKHGQKSPLQYARDLAAFARRHGAAEVVVDPSAEGFILQLREEAPELRVRRAHNAVAEGIQLTASVMEAGLLRIHPRCRRLIDELQGYSWDERAQEKGQDRPLKTNDHACDALRYGLMERRRELNRRVIQLDREKPLPPDPLAMARI